MLDYSKNLSKPSTPRYVLRDLTLLSEERYTFETDNQYILLTLGFGIGFGSIWRFPYLVFQNGFLFKKRWHIYDSILNFARYYWNSSILSRDNDGSTE